MNIQHDSEKGIRIFSFGMFNVTVGMDQSMTQLAFLDGGGPGSISQLLMLKEFMARLAFDLNVEVDEVYPADHVDLMGGVGFGG
jgi:hypothetical protein